MFFKYILSFKNIYRNNKFIKKQLSNVEKINKNHNVKEQFKNTIKKLEMHESHSAKPFVYIKSDRIK